MLRIFRSPRRRRRAAAPDRQDTEVVVLTMARNEAAMLPRWVAHYGAQVGPENLVVVDDRSTDGSTRDLPCPVHTIPGLKSQRFGEARMRMLSGIAAGLLETYDVAIFTDVDEFLVPDPAQFQGLRDYLRARADAEVLAPLALNVMHYPAREGALRKGRPILGQREFAKFAPVMCKPAIKQVPAAWCAASHGVENPYRVDPELFMLHMKFADRDLLRTASKFRHSLVSAEGRGKGSSWRHAPDELEGMVDRILSNVDVDRVPEFDPAAVDVDSLVIRHKGHWRSPMQSQMAALASEPLVRIPARLHGKV